MPKSKYKKTYFTSGRISEHCMQKEGNEQRGGPVHSKRRGAAHLCLQLSEYHFKYELQKHKRAKQMYRSPPCTSSLGTKGKSAWSTSALFPLIWPCDPDTCLNVSAAACGAQRTSLFHISTSSHPSAAICVRLSAVNKTTWTKEAKGEVSASHLQIDNQQKWNGTCLKVTSNSTPPHKLWIKFDQIHWKIYSHEF